MLLTLYYLAATWLQSWRLNSMRAKIAQIRKHNGSILLYKEAAVQLGHSVAGGKGAEETKKEVIAATTSSSSFGGYIAAGRGVVGDERGELGCGASGGPLQVQGVTGSRFIPEGKSQVGDLLWFTPGKSSLSLFPIPAVDISEWISVPGGKTTFPIPLKVSLQAPLSDQPASRVHLLLEAEFCAFHNMQIYHFHVEEFGVAKAWRADDNLFSLLLETDEDRLTRLATGFMLNTVSVGQGLELVRLQSVEVSGKPCFMLNTDWQTTPELAGKKLGVDGTWWPRKGMTASQWRSHILILRSFSRAAARALKTDDPVTVDGQRGVVVVRGPSPVALPSLSPLTADDVPDIDEHHQQHSAIAEENEEEEVEVEEEEGGACPQSNSPSVSVSVQRGSYSVEPSSTSASSFGSMSRLSNETLVAVSPSSSTRQQQKQQQYGGGGEGGGRSGSVTSLGSVSTASSPAAVSLSSPGHCQQQQPRVVVPHRSLSSYPSKPPNVIIFSESSVSVESIRAALSSTLNRQRYTIYSLSLSQMLTTPWLDQASLVVVAGSVPAGLRPRLISYVLGGAGGRLLCLCSDLLGTFLPCFRTAEVRPDELVTFSYSKWKHVRMMHHIFCYQPSPPPDAPSKFSQDDQTGGTSSSAGGGSGIPGSVEVEDGERKRHQLEVSVLGAEETWQTPSLLLAKGQTQGGGGGGKIIFSQVHLEADPAQYENDESKHRELRASDRARLEILADILTAHLGLSCCDRNAALPAYAPAYFLGTHQLKLELLDTLKTDGMEECGVLKLGGDLAIKFCGKGVAPPDATEQFMPVLMYACPDSFSTVAYFENLGTEKLGRLVIYSRVMTSSMSLISGRKLAHGLAVIPRLQTRGAGRGGNAWLSPDGCAMFSIQLHVPLEGSVLGRRLSLLQHLVTLATVSAICSLPGLQSLDLGVKWPNDVYAAGGTVKIGGAVVTSLLHNGIAVCNAGVGLNLKNREPTTCIDEMIAELNKKTGAKTPPLSFEKYFAVVFTELERIMGLVESGRIDDVISLYYKYWLHSGAEVSVVTADGSSRRVTIVGIDEFGFLRVQDRSGGGGVTPVEFTVQPDGNSFDMLSGLIAPKIN